MRKPLSLIRGARLMPLSGTMDAFASGVSKDGECLQESLIGRASPAKLLPAAKTLSGTYIFGGYLFGHYGHFLLESLSRAYVFKQCAPFPILFMSPNDRVYESQTRMFRFLDIRNELVLIKEPVEVERLIMSPPGSGIGPAHLSDDQLAALGVYPAGSEAPGEARVWLSRSRFKGGGLDNEKDIEAVLRDWGWTVVHPESMTYKEQVACVSTAACVAGLDGSAFYSALLADRVHGRFIVFSRRNLIPKMMQHFLERKIARHDTYIFPVDRVSGEGPEMITHLADVEQVLGVLRGI